MGTSLLEIQQHLHDHWKELKENYAVKDLAVFGSYVRGESSEQSDIDILVEFTKPPGIFKFLELEEYLGDILGVDVDLVSKKTLKPYIGKHILQEAAWYDPRLSRLSPRHP